VIIWVGVAKTTSASLQRRYILGAFVDLGNVLVDSILGMPDFSVIYVKE